MKRSPENPARFKASIRFTSSGLSSFHFECRPIAVPNFLRNSTRNTVRYSLAVRNGIAVDETARQDRS
jgi:hypothetical protein